MGDNQYYVYKKEVDWSVLNQGFSIPVTIQVVFQNILDKFLSRGQTKDIFLVIEGKTYKARLVNQKFDEKKYPKRKDILQIRYNPQSELAEKLRSVFYASYINILQQRNTLNKNQRKYIKMQNEQKEYLAIYTTEYDDTYYIECITEEDNQMVKKEMIKEDEQKYEADINI